MQGVNVPDSLVHHRAEWARLSTLHSKCRGFRVPNCEELSRDIPNTCRLTFSKTRTCSWSISRSEKSRKLLTGYRLRSQASILNDMNMGMDENQNCELKDAGSFAEIAEAGMVSVVGFGSLISEKSARYTFPDLKNFRLGRIRNYRRVFAHVAPIFLERGIARLDTKEMSSLSVEEKEGESIIVTVFEMALEEVPAFIEREHEFRFMAVYPETIEGTKMSQRAVICARYSDEEYLRVRLNGNKDEYHRRYGKWGIEKIWADDILPCRIYLRHCVLAAQNLNKRAYDSFLDHTFLGDRKTTIRSHLESNPSIMVELSPIELAERYGG